MAEDAPTDTLHIPAGAKNPEEARKFLAYVARPDARGRFPVVVVVSEVFGVHEYIRDVCHRLAELGYVAMARFDTSTGTWRDVPGTAASAHVLIASGAPVDGRFEMTYRYSVVDTVGAGTSEVQRNIIARRGLGLPVGS